MGRRLHLEFLKALENDEVKELRESGASIDEIANIYGVSRPTVSRCLAGIDIYMTCRECGGKYLAGKNDITHICDDCKEAKRYVQKTRSKSAPPKRKRTLNLSIDDILAIQSYTSRFTGKYYSYGQICNALYGGNRRYKIERR